MSAKPTQRGGARKGAGRPRLAAKDRPIAMTVRVRRPVHEKFEVWRKSQRLSQARGFSALVEKI